MQATASLGVLQQELEALRQELHELMAEWADTDCFAAQRLGQLECRRQLLLARIGMRERAIARYPQDHAQAVDNVPMPRAS